MNGHHHVNKSNILGRQELERQLGELCRADRDASSDQDQILDELIQIAERQWRASQARGLIKGFLLCGPPGTGKTTLAKRFAHELCRRFESAESAEPVVLSVIDGAEIATSRYGESEERIKDIFAHARAGFTERNQRSIVLFDDVESIFMARGNQNAKEWHLSQDSVFFHAIDDVDTSRTALVLTSNRPDLLDEAVCDRFLSYELGYPQADALASVGLSIARRSELPASAFAPLEAELRAAAAAGHVRSLRDVERFVVQAYLKTVLGRPSRARSSRYAAPQTDAD